MTPHAEGYNEAVEGLAAAQQRIRELEGKHQYLFKKIEEVAVMNDKLKARNDKLEAAAVADYGYRLELRARNVELEAVREAAERVKLARATTCHLRLVIALDHLEDALAATELPQDAQEPPLRV